MSYNIVKFTYDLHDLLSPKLRGIEKAMSSTANTFYQSAKRIEKNIADISDKAFSFSRSVAVMSTGLGGIGVKAIKSAADFETLGIQLEILTGSAEKGKNLFQELSKYSAETPFELPEIVKSTRTLLGSNIALKDVISTTKMLGDVAAGSGANLENLAVVYGQVAGATKLQGQDAMQFISNGIPIWALLQKTTGKTITQLKEMGSKGLISFDMVNKALKKSTEEAGMYYLATDKLSKSLGGMFSTLKDNINLAFANLGNEIVKVIELKNLIKEINTFADKTTKAFSSMSPETKKLIVYSGIFLTALLPIGLALGGFIYAIKQIITVFTVFIGLWKYFRILSAFNPFTSWLTIINLLSLGLGVIILHWDTILDKVKQIYEFIKKIFVESTRGSPFQKFMNKKFGWYEEELKTQTPIPIQMQQQKFSGGLDINFSNIPKNTTVFQRQSTPNLNLGINSTYAK